MDYDAKIAMTALKYFLVIKVQVVTVSGGKQMF